MKIVAALFANFQHSFLGAESPLMARIGERSVIEHTLERFRRIGEVNGHLLVTEPSAPALDIPEGVGVFTLDDGRRPRRRLHRSARKWNLDSWRGGLVGATWFDEFVEPALVGRVLNATQADAVLCMDAEQMLLDPELCTALVAHVRARQPEATFGFTAAPPGLCGLLLTRTETAALLERDVPAGFIFAYRPEMVRGDVTTHAACLQVDPAIARCRARLLPDTRCGRELLAAAHAALGEDAGGGSLCRWVTERGAYRSTQLPLEIELELTTAHPLPETTLRPRSATPQRALADLAAVERVARELGALDDRLVMLAGHGDPLLHPELPRVLRALREVGVCGIGLRTTLIDTPPANLDALFEYGVDVLQVELNAHSREVYARVHGADRFESVLAALDQIAAWRRERLSPQPLIAPSLTRCAATTEQVEPFFDDWIRRTGTALVEGYSEFGGLLPPDSLLRTTPPRREACRRLANRLMLLADGACTTCDQDVRGMQRLGDWTREDLGTIWAGRARERLQAAHAEQSLITLPVCSACHEWHRL